MYTRKQLHSDQRKMRVLVFEKTGLGTPVLGEGSLHGSITDNGVGDYTITFNKPFLRAPVCIPASTTSAKVARVSAVTTTTVRVLTFNQADGTTASEGDFSIQVMGFDDASAS